MVNWSGGNDKRLNFDTLVFEQKRRVLQLAQASKRWGQRGLRGLGGLTGGGGAREMEIPEAVVQLKGISKYGPPI